MLEVHQDLEVEGAAAALDTLLGRLRAARGSGWAYEPWGRDRDPDALAFRFDGMPPAFLHLRRSGPRLRVTNIVPREVGSLSRREYNDLLDAFRRDVLSPSAGDLPVIVSSTPGRLDISHWIGEGAAKRLRAFSASANRGTGSSHPLDFGRWVGFLIELHKEGAALDAGMLRRWLVEEEGWPEEEADELATEYEFARDLLRAYDAAR